MVAPGRRRILAATILVVVAGLSLLLVTALRSNGASTHFALLDHRAPALSGQSLTGGHVDLASMRGNVVLVNIWASWCAPCRQELPLIQRAKSAWADHGVKVVTINTRDGTTTARAFLQRVKATDLVTINDPKGKLAVSWGASGVPETFIVDRHGVVRARRIGAVTSGWLHRELTRWTRA